MWIINVISVLFVSCFRARLFRDALWSPAAVMSNYEVCHFPIGILGQVLCLI